MYGGVAVPAPGLHVSPSPISCLDRLVVQNYVEKRAVDLQAAVVMNETQFPEPVHEEADTRAGCAYHFRQYFLTNLGDNCLRCAFLAKMSKQQEDAGQSFFARIEKLIHQIFFVTDVPRQQIHHEQVGKLVLLMKRFHHGFPIDSQNSTIRHRGCRAHAERLTYKRTFATKISAT